MKMAKKLNWRKFATIHLIDDIDSQDHWSIDRDYVLNDLVSRVWEAAERKTAKKIYKSLVQEQLREGE